MSTRIKIPTELGLNEITSIKRKLNVNRDKVSSIIINDVENQITEYELINEIHSKIPDNWNGVIKQPSGEKEIWTLDGLYAFKNEGDLIVIDFLRKNNKEDMKEYYDQITGASKEISNNIVKDIIKNSLNYKEFYVVDENGIEDDIVAKIDGNYYIDSLNYYKGKDISSGNEMILTDWKIPESDYRVLSDVPVGDLTGKMKNLYINPKNLFVLFNYIGMPENDTTEYLTVDDKLIYIKNTTVDEIEYQVYLNMNFIYDTSGMISALDDNFNTIKIKDIFSREELTGKTLRVW